MKTNLKNAFFVSLLVVCTTGIFSSCDKDDDDVDNRNYTVTGNASGTQVVPAIGGTGTATFNGTYNPTTNTMSYSSSWNGLTGVPSSAGFYSGASGTSGTAVGTPWSIEAGGTGTGTTTGTITLTEEQETQMLAGNWYYSYGTATNTTGEVRGQLTATR